MRDSTVAEGANLVGAVLGACGLHAEHLAVPISFDTGGQQHVHAERG